MDWTTESGREEAEPARFEALPRLDASDHVLPLRDPVAMGDLLTRLEPRLCAVALGFTRDPDAARDVVQNAFEKVLRHGHKFLGHSRVTTWIHRIVANEALMWLRSQRRRNDVGWDEEDEGIEIAADPAPSPLEHLEHARRTSRLRNGLTELSADESNVMRRCAIEGLSYAEYGAENGLHVAAVKSRAFRARRRLARLLRE
ncbi:MAG: RNA polymerase sigma factor [Myxococcota bacterium]